MSIFLLSISSCHIIWFYVLSKYIKTVNYYIKKICQIVAQRLNGQITVKYNTVKIKKGLPIVKRDIQNIIMKLCKIQE